MNSLPDGQARSQLLQTFADMPSDYRARAASGPVCSVGKVKRIPLRNRAGGVRAYALVDDNDYERVAAFRWCFDSGYAGRRAWIGGDRYERIKMHRFVLGLAAGELRHVDHINRNKLDNRRENLRLVAGRHEQVQNRPSWGRSQHRGVSWHKGSGRWVARVKVDGVIHYLGYFHDEDEAGEAAREGRARLMPLAVD
jgi:hypothetical protein